MIINQFSHATGRYRARREVLKVMKPSDVRVGKGHARTLHPYQPRYHSDDTADLTHICSNPERIAKQGRGALINIDLY